MRPIRTTGAIALVGLSVWPAVVRAHETGATAQSPDSAVPFVVAIGVSTFLSVAVGLGAVRHYRTKLATDLVHGSTTRIEMTVLLFVLGLVALLSAAAQQPAAAVGAAILGGTLAWIARAGGVSPHDGCADAAFGAILLHRIVEGILVAGVYAASAALGLLGLVFLTVHAVGETVAIGGLYAPVGRGWGIASVVTIHLGFLVGAFVGYHATGILSTPIVTVFLAAVGGVLLVTGATEFASTIRRRRLEVAPDPRPEP
ncbi:hypothetical protein CV102_07970 [Natronococcus pandeyae]|uniref:Uncharacterized protein n=1 Tax=Natronococcus pandeyae TaxID=2055836 RepID=A0A8J8Q5Y5_9EURY|nr:hypothetical protein [Natronococcus pandeyae]TYL39213.1 hypothetical protein CV102_07970 [Natronococcus pandeyae]